MTLETMAVKGAVDGVKTIANGAKETQRQADSALKKFWSVLDAAAEKQSPSQALSPKAIGSIQGKAQG